MKPVPMALSEGNYRFQVGTIARKLTFAALWTPQALVLAGALVIALASVCNHAGSWNDGSRLATVESLVDHGTLAIDRSIFVQIPADFTPYAGDNIKLLKHGTNDKLLIDGHYYSDKSPVPALFMAGAYQILQWTCGLTAQEHPQAFCYWMNFLSSGLAYVVAVWCVFQLGVPLRLPMSLRLALTGSFALATTALPYLRYANNHILLLAVAAALFLNAAWLADDVKSGRTVWARILIIGVLAGLGYTIDLGAGPVLVVGAFGLVVARCRRLYAGAIFALAAFPWFLAHHFVNYAVGGTIQPANAVAEYLNWPGSPFGPHNMTGSLNHTAGHFLVYSASLLFGNRGFIGHNPPLFLAIVGACFLLWKRTSELPEILFALFWCGGTWMAYAISSNNYSGACCSIRWFVPLLAPGFYILAVFLRDYPSYRWDFLVLTGAGVIIAALAWVAGPWMMRMVPLYWLWEIAAYVGWIRVRRWRLCVETDAQAIRPAKRIRQAA